MFPAFSHRYCQRSQYIHAARHSSTAKQYLSCQIHRYPVDAHLILLQLFIMKCNIHLYGICIMIAFFIHYYFIFKSIAVYCLSFGYLQYVNRLYLSAYQFSQEFPIVYFLPLHDLCIMQPQRTAAAHSKILYLYSSYPTLFSGSCLFLPIGSVRSSTSITV